jgi:hypothetical protein
MKLRQGLGEVQSCAHRAALLCPRLIIGWNILNGAMSSTVVPNRTALRANRPTQLGDQVLHAAGWNNSAWLSVSGEERHFNDETFDPLLQHFYTGRDLVPCIHIRARPD